MPEEGSVCCELDRVLARFPEMGALARRLFRSSTAFGGLCEDYRLAQDGLARLEGVAAPPPAELAEYRVLVQELETELRQMFHEAIHRVSPGAGDAEGPPG